MTAGMSESSKESQGVPGVASQGETIQDLEENIRDAYRMMLEEEEKTPTGSQTKPLVIDG